MRSKKGTRGKNFKQICVEKGRNVRNAPASTARTVRDLVVVSAATLTIVRDLYDFYKKVKSENGRVYARAS